MSFVILQSADGKSFKVDVKIANVSVALKTWIEIFGVSEEPIPIQNVDGDVLEKIIQWATFHADDPVKNGPSAAELEYQEKHGCSSSRDICEWDKNFFKGLNPSQLAELTTAVYHLKIKGLIDVSCKTIANMIKDCNSVEEIRQLLGVKADDVPMDEWIMPENE